MKADARGGRYWQRAEIIARDWTPEQALARVHADRPAARADLPALRPGNPGRLARGARRSSPTSVRSAVLTPPRRSGEKRVASAKYTRIYAAANTWFKKATIEQLSDVQWPTPNHLYWPQLDADLSVESIRDPAVFPLVSKTAA